MTQRTDRIDELLRQEIGAIVARDIADPRVGFVTITEVETAPDLRHAKVWVSVIGQPDERREAIRALGHAMPFIRHQLGERLRLKRIPELHVRPDDAAERGTRMLRLISDLEAGQIPDVSGPPPKTGESLPTPVPRLPHEGDSEIRPDGVPQPVERAAPKGGRPRGGDRRGRRAPADGARRTEGDPKRGDRRGRGGRP